MIQEAKVLSVSPSQESNKPNLSGKFLTDHHRKFWVKGVTYGTFRSRQGQEYNPYLVEIDFALMRQNHVNSIRVYTIPPRWMLDLAQNYGLRVFFGFPWEQHVTFLDDALTAAGIRQKLKDSLQEVAGHPAILCCSIGNEIPSTIVRWHGAKKVQQFLRSLYDTAKDCHPDLLVTYVNYPSTEYLHLPFLDLFCFNVFLESKTDFNAYLLRLQNLAGEKPLFLTEIGLDSRRNGLERQARLLRSQIWSSFRQGCAGVFVYSWTDEWFRGGQDIEDWDFGLTTRDRRPKPALDAVRKQFSKVPFLSKQESPKISVVVCSYNGSKTIEQCLESLTRLKYDNYEVLVIDDGSTDSTAAIASRFPVRLIRTPNQGLSAARNLGMQEAKGEILAYIDDDAYADPHWLHFLSIAFQETGHACVGGPNLAPPGDGFLARCVAHSPGGPLHVLLSDDEAEHVPGCNLAIRKDALEAIGGFDPQFRAAGDDVDLCWSLQNAGFTIGYHSGALVWHHRRNSISAYWRQQRGYGKAEVLLARKWPEKYNGVGHVTWAGRIYQNGFFTAGRIYSGIWGAAPFQSLYQRSEGLLSSITHMPEWILVILILFFLTGIGFAWTPLSFAAILLMGAILLPIVKAFHAVSGAVEMASDSKWNHFKTIVISAFLYCAQPVARFVGRWPLWRPTHKNFIFPVRKRVSIWSEDWEEQCSRLSSLMDICKQQGAIVAHGNSFDRWDLETKGGGFGSARLLMGVEEHGQGKQMTCFRVYPHVSRFWTAIVFFVFLFGCAAAFQGEWLPALFLMAFSVSWGARILLECGRAMSVFVRSIHLIQSNSSHISTGINE